MTRTSIDIDDELIETVMHTYRLGSKRAAVDFALRKTLYDPMDTDAALAMEGSGWDGDLDEMRIESIAGLAKLECLAVLVLSYRQERTLAPVASCQILREC